MSFKSSTAISSNTVKFSAQQATFLDWCINGTGSCVLEAKAGAGKSTTLVQAAIQMPGQVAMLAYNKKAADDLQKKLDQNGVDWKKAQAGTVHSFAFKAYRKQFTNTVVDGNKVSNIAGQLIREGDVLFPHISVLVKMVSLAKQRALGIVSNIDNVSDWIDIIEHFDLMNDMEEDEAGQLPSTDSLCRQAIAILKASNKITTTVDFDDMIYLALFYKVKMWQFDTVMVDEAQDTNPARRAFVRALVKRGGRVIAVGDRNQAIYGFTGADNDSLDLIASDFNCIKLPLTVSFRCPKSVIKFAQSWVQDIESAPNAIEGSVSSTTIEDMMARNDLDKETSILCRNTAPLVDLAFNLIRRRVACKVEGRDIGAGLKKLATKWKRIKTLAALTKQLDAYLDQQRVRLLAKKQEMVFQSIEDQVETLKVIMEQCQAEKTDSVDAVVSYIDSLFADGVENVMVLSTIHKSKGREWKKVFWLNRAGTCPSPYARQAWQQEQERNLMYVAATRAQVDLIEIIVPQKAKGQGVRVDGR